MIEQLPLVHLSVLRPIVRALEELGVDPDPVARSVGLSAEAIRREGAVVHVMSIHPFLEACAHAAQDPMFCAKVGAQLDSAGWPMIAKAKQHARSLGDFLNTYVSGAATVSSSVEVFLDVRGKVATFGQTRRAMPDIVPSQNDAFMASLKLRMLKSVLGDSMNPADIVIVLSDPSVVPFIEQGYQVLRGDRSGCRIRFPSEWLTEPMNGSAHSGARAHKPTERPQASFLESFRALLVQNVGEGGLDANEAARLAYMNRRKLSDELASQGSSIAKEVRRAMLSFACEKLRSSEMTVEEIALALGYSDASNFTRAFSKEVGTAPSNYRCLQRELTA